jgi:uncharacterized protein YcfL
MTIRGLVISLGLSLAPALVPMLGCSRTPAPGSSPTEAQAQAQASAVAVGARAPEAQLVGTAGQKVALAELLPQHAQTVIVFYRGFW